ncbi:hypothetical protein B9Z55_017367 [Caenorhabditis nigoni]|uniref:Nuclear receptor domain-containing protein n=1 Tax=Caenorhabditis nigoni TaxID=1611254 RepID=A0A2G5T9D5_9PELO|nr:hypothetical protein B9Z55_017367 [Caenorhabditis nigoni]
MVHVAKKCVICARLTSDFSYGVDCCSACKMFFRRHVVAEAQLKPCLSGNQACAKDFLAGCQFCRFHKCLQSGMTLEPLVPKLPFEELFEIFSDFVRYRNRILSDYYPSDPDLKLDTVSRISKFSALLDLSETGQILVSTYQSVYSNALFEYCMETYEKFGPCRYTELLSLINLAEKHLEDVNNYFVILQLHGMDFLIPELVKEGINLI